MVLFKKKKGGSAHTSISMVSLMPSQQHVFQFLLSTKVNRSSKQKKKEEKARAMASAIGRAAGIAIEWTG